MIQRLAACALGLACVIAILFLVTFQSRGTDFDGEWRRDQLTCEEPVSARIDDTEDFSDPDLVKGYFGMPCDALAQSYEFQYNELTHITGRLLACHKAAAENPDYIYGELMCAYIQIQWNLMWTHAKSVEKAWQIMCDDNGVRKYPEYEIDF